MLLHNVHSGQKVSPDISHIASSILLLADFRNSFTVAISRKFAIRQSLNIPSHLKRVATLGLLFEILMSEN